MKYFDENGNEVSGFSQEELDAKLKEVQDAATKASEEAVQKALAEAGSKNSDDDAGGDKMPDWFKPFADKIGTMETNTKSTTISRVVSGLDADKRKEVESKFENLQGYDGTPEAQARRAEDAFLLVTGSKFDAGALNMGNMMAGGGGKNQESTEKTSEADKNIRAALGISDADVEKFGKK